jgi:predicted flavoprotein YhiN
VRGEAIVTRTGIEGGAIYALSAELREAILRDGHATLNIALRPDAETGELIAKLSAAKGKQSFSNFLRKTANLSPIAIGLLQESAKTYGKSLAALSPADLARLIQAVPVQLNGIAPIARAISTAGGIALDELDDAFMIRRLPGVFAAGEMLDWEAPTGGYLLQASFATGVAAGRGALNWLDRKI